MKKEQLKKLSVFLFILSSLMVISFELSKITGFAIVYAKDPNPLYGIVFLIISIVSATIYFWIHIHHKTSTSKKN